MRRNVLVAGVWRTDIEPYADEEGAFDRSETTFRDRVPGDAPTTRQSG